MPNRHAFVFISSFGALFLTSCLQSASAPSSSPSATATSSPSTIAASSPTPTTATKRTPTPVVAERPSDLVVRHEVAGDTGFPVPWVVVTADGRFVTRSDDNQLRERRLTPAGVQRLRDELTATGLLERDQQFPLLVRPDATRPAHGIGTLFFKVWRDTRTVEVQTATGQGAEEVYYEPSPARTRLDQLSKQLLRPETWLSAGDWAEPTAHPYEARFFALLLSGEVGTSNMTPTIDSLTAAWPFSAGPLVLGDPLPPAAGPLGYATRCSALTSDDALAVKNAIGRAGGADAIHPSPDGTIYSSFPRADNQGALVVVLRPLFPDRASCSGEYAP